MSVPSEITPLQRAIGQAVARSFWDMIGGAPDDGEPALTPTAGDLQLAYDVLAMPEMQAIKQYICEVFDRDPWSYEHDQNHLLSRGLPESVVQWLLPDDERPWLQP